MAETKVKDFNGKVHISNNQVDADKLLVSLQNQITVDVQEQAGVEATHGLRRVQRAPTHGLAREIGPSTSNRVED
jgi:hypothetical protein